MNLPSTAAAAHAITEGTLIAPASMSSLAEHADGSTGRDRIATPSASRCSTAMRVSSLQQDMLAELASGKCAGPPADGMIKSGCSAGA